MKEIADECSAKGVREDLLPHPQALSPANLESEYFVYDLPTRYSKTQILKKYVKKIADAQTLYLSQVEEAQSFLQNINMAIKMDTDLNDTVDSEKEEKMEEHVRETLTDGTKRLQCPFFSCRIKTFRLQRHLDTVHSNLTDTVKRKALMFARTIVQ